MRPPIEKIAETINISRGEMWSKKLTSSPALASNSLSKTKFIHEADDSIAPSEIKAIIEGKNGIALEEYHIPNKRKTPDIIQEDKRDVLIYSNIFVSIFDRYVFFFSTGEFIFTKQMKRKYLTYIFLLFPVRDMRAQRENTMRITIMRQKDKDVPVEKIIKDDENICKESR